MTFPNRTRLVDQVEAENTTTISSKLRRNETEGKQAKGRCGQGQLKEASAGRRRFIPDRRRRGRLVPEGSLKKAWHDLEAIVVRDAILSGVRLRRAWHRMSCERFPATVDLLPRVHGSALFQRGETQAFITDRAWHRTRRTTRRRAVGRVLEEIHARLQLPVVLGRRVPSDSWPGAS